jgi:sugar phosphate isomerase/epimerase
MNGNIREFARIGLVHHMLYPASNDNAAHHLETLKAFIKDEAIETFDCCLPMDGSGRQEIADLIKEKSLSDVAYATHLYPMRKLSFASPSDSDQAIARILVNEMIESAAAIGADRFIFATGGPPHGQANPTHYEALAGFCKWLSAALKPHNMTALLEPFDWTIDKKFLYGPTAKCVELIESLKPNVDNMAIELDMAHLPLMGESFEKAITAAGPYLKRVHLGNCILKDKDEPLYGDTHPPIGYPGGEIDVPELTTILRLLLDVGFLNQENRGSLVIEMIPWPGKSVAETVEDSFNRLTTAWRRV